MRNTTTKKTFKLGSGGRRLEILQNTFACESGWKSRAKPYSDEEIKTAFRAKAMEYHPDQNQSNKDVAEAKFKEVMMSYEAIKLERKNGKP